MVIQKLAGTFINRHSAARQVLNKAVGHGNVARCISSASPWADFAMAPLDPIVGLNESYNLDDFPQKVIVGVGAYRDDAGKPYVLPCVREAEKRLMDQNLDMEYAGIVSSNFNADDPGYIFGDRYARLIDSLSFFSYLNRPGMQNLWIWLSNLGTVKIPFR